MVVVLSWFPSSQASPSQEKIQELLAAVDKGNVSDVKLILEDPNIEVNRGNKVCLSGVHTQYPYVSSE